MQEICFEALINSVKQKTQFMYKKTVYLIIIFILSFILFNYLSTQSQQNNQDISANASFLINRQSTDPKRLFLKTWRIARSKYYDPTMNNQDWSRWNKRYVDKIKTQDDANVAIDSMIASLNDPYTQFLDKEEYREQTTSIDAKITGIGVNIIALDGNVLIVSVVEDTPAEENGLKSGDIILSVNGKEVRGKTVSDVAALIRGKESESVKIELQRDKKKLTKNITRREIKIKSVKTKILDKTIGYVQISSFISGDVTKEFIEALTKIQNCEGLIMDLRGNTGGLMPNAVFIADMFLTEGHIVSIVDRNKQRSDIDAQKKPYSINKPVVILVDQSSASASEILGAALKENKKAILVGERTFGKAMIQRIIPLPNETGLNLTIAKYLTPKGHDLNKNGITPDYTVAYTEQDFLKNKDPQLDKAKSILKNLIKSKHQNHHELARLKQ